MNYIRTARSTKSARSQWPSSAENGANRLRALPALIAACSALPFPSAAEEPPSAGPFAARGYYVTFSRMPTYDLVDWERVVDAVADDGGNTLVLWLGGGFRSNRYPATWAHNAEHENVRKDFVRDLIRHAHARGVKVLLGFTPFGYDGVNLYSLEHPELAAVGQDGGPVALFGIHSWGRNLCPSRPESQRFMLAYARELAFEFYPEADGLLLESSDYAACHCEDCRGRYFEREFAFVRAISDEVWAKNPDATVVVYPHYFSGSEVPGLGVKGAKLPFDPRWTVMFTPHSASPEPALIAKAKGSWWWDDAPARRGPAEVKAGAERARREGMTGYVPSFEAFTFVAAEAEEGQAWLKGKRQVPLGFGWLGPGEPPYDELPARVSRLAYREFSRDPDLPLDQFERVLGTELLGEAATEDDVADLFAVQKAFADGRTWCQPSPVTSPERVRAMAAVGELRPQVRADVRAMLDRLKAVAARHREAPSEGGRELRRIAEWAVDQWGDGDLKLLSDDAAAEPD